MKSRTRQKTRGSIHCRANVQANSVDVQELKADVRWDRKCVQAQTTDVQVDSDSKGINIG